MRWSREGGVLTTLGTREWLVSAFPQDQSVDALFAVVMRTRKNFMVGVIL